MKKFAVFDIDGTIFRSSLLIELVEALMRAGIFPKDARKKGYAKELKAWQGRTGSYEDYIEAVVKTFMKHIKGVHYGDFSDVSKEVIKLHQHKTYQFTRDLVAKYKKKGYFLLAISHSPKTIVDKFCKSLGFDKVYGMVYELGPSDRLTGEIADLHLIRNKGAIVRRAIEKNDLTLKGSVAVGDTEGDISMLEMVDNPICFNPNAKLYKYAKRNDWRVVVERKDVVYEMNKK